jgi:hypothetical protein
VPAKLLQCPHLIINRTDEFLGMNLHVFHISHYPIPPKTED